MTPSGAGSGGGGGGGSGGNSRKRRSGNKGRQAGPGQAPPSGNARSSSGNRRRSGGADFWGRPAEGGPPSDRKVRTTIDPGAVVRSLGDPPLGPNPATAAHHLTAIYEEAVKAATALAAANGLLEDDSL